MGGRVAAKLGWRKGTAALGVRTDREPTSECECDGGGRAASTESDAVGHTLPSAPEVTCAIQTDAKCSVSAPNLAAAAFTSPAAASISACQVCAREKGGGECHGEKSGRGRRASRTSGVPAADSVSAYHGGRERLVIIQALWRGFDQGTSFALNRTVAAFLRPPASGAWRKAELVPKHAPSESRRRLSFIGRLYGRVDSCASRSMSVTQIDHKIQ